MDYLSLFNTAFYITEKRSLTPKALYKLSVKEPSAGCLKSLHPSFERENG
jgi:hypothetical protein